MDFFNAIDTLNRWWFSTNSFFSSSLPWNDDTFIGWLYGLLMSFLMSGTYFFMNSIFLSCFLSVGFNFDAFRKHYNHLLLQINAENSRNVDVNRQTRVALFRAIEFHNSIKKWVSRRTWKHRLMCLIVCLNLRRLFKEIKAVYSGIIFAQLVCGTWFIAASLFQMDMVIKWIHNFEKLFHFGIIPKITVFADSIFRRLGIWTFTSHRISIRLHWALPIYTCIATRVHQLLRIAWNIQRWYLRKIGI